MTRSPWFSANCEVTYPGSIGVSFFGGSALICSPVMALCADGNFFPEALDTTLNFSPVTVFCTHTLLSTISSFSRASLSATAPLDFNSFTVGLCLAALLASAVGVYQMGEVHARSCTVGGIAPGGGMPSSWAWIVVQRGVGISRARA